MKKRLRKKKHLGQFKEFGWYVEYQFESPDREPEAYFWDILINKVESMGLEIGGSVVSFFATLEHRASLDIVQERQEELHQWLTQQRGVADVTSSPLTDAWYGPFEK